MFSPWLRLDGASGGTGGYAVATSSIVCNHTVSITSAQILGGSVFFTFKFTLGLVFLDPSGPITLAFTAGDASVRTKCSTVGAISTSTISWKCLLSASIIRSVVWLVWMTAWLAFEVAECSVLSSGSGISNAEGEGVGEKGIRYQKYELSSRRMTTADANRRAMTHKKCILTQETSSSYSSKYAVEIP